MRKVTNVEELEAIYGKPREEATVKVTPFITPEYRALIEASPFAILASVGPEGLDCSPRGDKQQLATIIDGSTIRIPDRRGNNRIDSLRNIVRDPRVALLFLIPGCVNTLRINGRACIILDEAVLDSFAMEGFRPRSVIEIVVDEIYFQCGRAILRSGIWDTATIEAVRELPTPGQILAGLSSGRVGGDGYDQEWPERARKTLW